MSNSLVSQYFDPSQYPEIFPEWTDENFPGGTEAEVRFKITSYGDPGGWTSYGGDPPTPPEIEIHQILSIHSIEPRERGWKVSNQQEQWIHDMVIENYEFDDDSDFDDRRDYND